MGDRTGFITVDIRIGSLVGEVGFKTDSVKEKMKLK
jgi:hypothetical protein